MRGTRGGRGHRGLWVAVALFLAGGLGGVVVGTGALPAGAGCDPPPGRAVPPSSTAPPPTLSPAAASAALARLATLAVRPAAPRTGYDRDHFGQRWADVDRNGCDTRNDILNRDLQDKAWKPKTRNCVVVSGRLADPYTGRTLTFEKAHAGAIQIDHVVSLSNAWETGAQGLSPDERKQFANDPLNLLATDGPTNESKGDADAAEWLVPNAAFRCELVARQIDVKARYRLWTTSREHEAMERVLRTCLSPRE